MKKNEAQVKVKDMIKYLQTKLDPETPIYLDRDGWTDTEPEPYDENLALEIIDESGLFHFLQEKNPTCVFINN